jgi:hypothetical protein
MPVFGVVDNTNRARVVVDAERNAGGRLALRSNAV